MLIGSACVLHFGQNKRATSSLARPDPLFAQERYRLQYKRPARIARAQAITSLRE